MDFLASHILAGRACRILALLGRRFLGKLCLHLLQTFLRTLFEITVMTVIGDFPSLLPAGEQVLIEVIDHLFVDAVLLDLEDQDVIV